MNPDAGGFVALPKGATMTYAGRQIFALILGVAFAVAIGACSTTASLLGGMAAP